MRKVWFTADTHFGCLKIPLYAKRLFCLNQKEKDLIEAHGNQRSRIESSTSRESVERMDKRIIDSINERVNEDDILWHLGDFCWAKSGHQRDTARRYLNCIRCKNVFLVSGNHDHPGVKSAFKEHYEYKEIKVSSKHIVLSHYSHCFWNRSHYGSWMLYGHAHGTAEDWLDNQMPGRFSMDVGVDNAFKIFGEYRPISSDEIGELFSSRNGFHVDRTRKISD